MTSRDRTPPVTFRDFSLEGLIEIRRREGESLGLTAKRDIARYYSLLQIGLKGLDGRFTDTEMQFILSSCKETGWGETEKNVRYLHFELRDAIEIFDGNGNHTFESYWKFRGDDLIAKIRNMTNDKAWALIDLIECFWLSPPQQFPFVNLREHLEGHFELKLADREPMPDVVDVVDTPLTGAVADADLVEEDSL